MLGDDDGRDKNRHAGFDWGPLADARTISFIVYDLSATDERNRSKVFGSLVEKPASVARIGGDEFAVLLPGTDIAGGEAVLDTLAGLVELNNQFYPDFELSISTGIATSRPGNRLEQVVKRADTKMLHAKRLYYLQANRDRRGTGAA